MGGLRNLFCGGPALGFRLPHPLFKPGSDQLKYYEYSIVLCNVVMI